MIATVIVALIAAISAIVSPVITTLINNKHQLKVKRIELYENLVINTIRKYFSSAEDYVDIGDNESLKTFNECKNTIYFYTPVEIWHKIDICNMAIEELWDDNRQLQHESNEEKILFLRDNIGCHSYEIKMYLKDLAQELSPTMQKYYKQ